MIDKTLCNIVASLGLLLPSFALQAYTVGGEDVGYTIEIEEGYQSFSSSGFHIFRSPDDSRTVMIRHWPGLDMEAIEEYISSGYQNERIALVAEDEPVDITLENGSGKLVDIVGIVERRKVDGAAGGFVGKDGQGFIIVSYSESEDWPGFDKAVNRLSESVRFEPPGESKAGFDARDWRYVLSGARLALRDENDGRMMREDYSFCSNGRYYHMRVEQLSMHDDLASSFGMSRTSNSGNWRVVDVDGQSRLQLRDNDGKVHDFRIEDRDGKTYIDDTRYYLLQNRRCR